jgi:hypothetical protein
MNPKDLGQMHKPPPPPPNPSPPLNAKGIKRVQQIVGGILYYSWVVDMTVLMALSSIAVEQTTATTRTIQRCIELLDYLAKKSHVQVHLHASDMIMNIHSDASYMLKTKARSSICRHFFMGWMPKNGETIKLNGTF